MCCREPMPLIRRMRNTRFSSQALLGFSLSSFGSAVLGIVGPGGRARALALFSLTYLFVVLNFYLSGKKKLPTGTASLEPTSDSKYSLINCKGNWKEKISFRLGACFLKGHIKSTWLHNERDKQSQQQVLLIRENLFPLGISSTNHQITVFHSQTTIQRCSLIWWFLPCQQAGYTRLLPHPPVLTHYVAIRL